VTSISKLQVLFIVHKICYKCRDVGLEINAEKTKYMIMSRHPNSGQNQNIRTANESFERVATLKYLATTVKIRMIFLMKSRVG
jgi:hypothetical protein